MKTFKRLFLSLWHGIRFESGYVYKKTKSPYLQGIEYLHKEMIGDGWDVAQSVEPSFNYFYVWYRKRNDE